MIDLSGKRAFVTGATGGLGQAIARGLAQAGARVALGYNSAAAAAEALAADLPGEGHLPLRAPVTDSPALTAAAGAIRDVFGGLDILVNCAGITRFVPHGDLDGLDDQIIDDILAVNVRGVIAATRAMRPMLDETGKGVVVNISSIAARTAMGSNIAYAASKAAVDNLTLSLARALAPRIRVLSVAPGLVDTEFVKALSQDWRDEQAARTPLGDLAQPEHVADAVVAAAGLLTYSTGAVIAVDGGRPLG
ncbi:MAG: SDR family oxidoreductase [Paracoccaceae bacterium]